MSHPRHIVPVTTYLITRRVLRRHLLLRPDAAVTRVLLYTLAVSAHRYGVQVHALCAMSTHLHLVVTDVEGVLPRFLQFFHRIVALSIKVVRKWEGPAWDPEATSVVRLLTREAIVEKIAYVIANPVAAGLVRHSREWPGAQVDVSLMGRGALGAKRLPGYLDPENPQWPEEAALPIHRPPGIGPEEAEGFRWDVAAELERQEEAARREVAARASLLGSGASAHGFSLRARHELGGLTRSESDIRRGARAGREWRGAAGAVRAFRASYREALERWCAGVRSAVFPAGMWWMGMFHGAAVSATRRAE